MADPVAPTTLDFLEFSELAYDLTSDLGLATVPVPAGFTFLGKSPVSSSGLTAVAFINKTTNQIVIAYRGTSPDAVYDDWIKADFGHIVPGIPGPSFVDAEKFAELVQQNNSTSTIYVTGHSLGGAEAEYVAATLGKKINTQIPGVTFAAPGISNMLDKSIILDAPPSIDPLLTDYVNDYDPVGNYTGSTALGLGPGQHVGNTIDLSASAAYSALFRATIRTIGGQIGLFAVFHPLGAYSAALLRHGDINFNPIGQSSIEPIDLGAVYSNIQNLSSGPDLNGNFTETGVVPLAVANGTINMNVLEVASPSLGLTFTTSFTEDNGDTVKQTVGFNLQNIVTLDMTTVNGATIETSPLEQATINVGSDGAIIFGGSPSLNGGQITINTDSNGTQIISFGSSSSLSSPTGIRFTTGTLAGITVSIDPTTGAVSMPVGADGFSLPFGKTNIPIPGGDTIKLMKVGDPTYIVEVEDSNGSPVYQISYGSDGTDTLDKFGSANSSNDIVQTPIAEQDIEYADGTSVITTQSGSTTTISAYSGPDGTGTLLNPITYGNYREYFWLGGAGAFESADSWSVPAYDPNATPPDPKPTAPGYYSNVTFNAGGLAAGPGDVSTISVNAVVTFTGIIEAGVVGISGDLDVQGTLLGTGYHANTDYGGGGIENDGVLTVEGAVDAVVGGTNSGQAALLNTGSFTVQDGGDVTVADYEQNGGSAEVLAGSDLATLSYFQIVGGGKLSVDGADALVNAGDGAVDIGMSESQDVYTGGNGTLSLSNGGQFVADFVTMGEDYAYENIKSSGTLTIDSDAGADVGDVSVALSSSILVEGAGSQLRAAGVELGDDGETGTGDAAAPSLTVLDGATATIGGLGLQPDDGVLPTALVDGAGSELDANYIDIGSGTVTVSDSASIQLDETIGNDFPVLEIGDDSLAAGALLIEDSGQFNLDGDATQAIIGEYAGDSGSAAVSGTNSVLDLGDNQLLVGDSGAGILTISAGGGVDAGEIDIAHAPGSSGLVTVDGATSVLSGSSLEIGQGAGLGKLSITNGAVVSVSAAVISSSGTVTLTGGDLSTDTLFVGGDISGTGTIDGEITDNGTITAAGGLLDLTGDVTGTGTLIIDNGATLEIDGSLAPGVTVAYAGAGAVLNLGSAATSIGAVSAVGGDVAAIDGDVVNDTLTVGLLSSGTQAAATVDGADTTYSVTNALMVYGGTVTVSDAAVVNLSEQAIQESDGSTLEAYFDVGTSESLGSGYGSLLIESGGQVQETGTSDPAGEAIFGDSVYDTGIGTVTGPGSDLDLGSSDLVVGNSGYGALTVSDGGLVTTGFVQIGVEDTTDPFGDPEYGNGTVTVKDAGSLLSTSDLQVGIYGFGTLAIAGGGTVFTDDAYVGIGGVVSLANGELQADSLSMNGTLSGYGTLAVNEVDNYGGITATGGLLDITGYLSGGAMVVDDGATLELDGQISSAMTLQFAGADGVLSLGDPADDYGTITGVAFGDTIDLINDAYEDGDQANLLSGNVLQITEVNGNVFDLQLDPTADYSDDGFNLTSDGLSGTDITVGAIGAAGLSITGTQADQMAGDQDLIHPFANVTIAETGSVTETATVTLSTIADGTLSNLTSGSYDDTAGVYTVSGSTTEVTAALDGLVFKPTGFLGAPGDIFTTGFDLAVSSTSGATAGDDTTSVTITTTATWDIPFGGLEIPGASHGQTIDFPAGTGLLLLDQPSLTQLTIEDFASGDHIDLVGVSPTIAPVLVGGTLSIGAVHLGFIGDYAGQVFSLVTGVGGAAELTVATPVTASGRQTLALDAEGDNNATVYGYANHIIGRGEGDAVVMVGPGLNNVVSLGGGNNVVTTAPGSAYSSITLGDGVNQVNLGGTLNTVRLGDGANTVAMTGSNNSITAGHGPDSVSGGTDNNSVTLGDVMYDADIVALGGWGNSVTVGDGDDTIDAGAGSATIHLGGGSDTVTLHGRSNTVTAGDGDDSVTGGGKSDTVILGNGDDNVQLGGGLNLITLGDGRNTVSAGSGQDSVTVGGGVNAITLAGSDNVVVGGNGDDSVTGTGSIQDSITLGDGADTVHLDGDHNTIHLGNGADSVTLGGQVNTVVAGNGGVSITGGTGNNHVSVGTGTNTVQLGGWGNSFSIGGGTSVVDAGLGSSTIQVADGVLSLTLHGRADMVFLHNTAQASIADGSAGLKLSIDSGNVVASITGFGASSGAVLDLAGAGFASVAQVLAALRSDGHGGTALALGGTGSVDFQNLAPSALHSGNFSVV